MFDLSIKGSPYSRFRAALRSGNLTSVRLAAAELPQVDLTDALAICLLMGAQDDPRFERAAVRWLARLCLERPDLSLEDLRHGAVALDALPANGDAARQSLADLCQRLRIHDAVCLLQATR